MPPSINYDSKHELRAFLENRGLGMRKKYGQNFLINGVVRSRLLDTLDIQGGDSVWEIGSGIGAMTRGLLEKGALVTAFEIDKAFVQILREIFECESFSCEDIPFPDKTFKGKIILIEGDVLKTWQLVQVDEGKELFLLGNLPYNIAAALLADFVEKKRFFKRMVVTVQKEVALRMCAGPGTADYSSFSVLCSSAYKVTPIQTIGGSSFYPEPRVDSQAIRLDLIKGREELPKLFYPLVRSLFSNRRKTIKNTLSQFASSVIIRNPVNRRNTENHIPAGNGEFTPAVSVKEIAVEILRQAGISGDRRAETLEINEFRVLAALTEEMVSHEIGHCSPA